MKKLYDPHAEHSKGGTEMLTVLTRLQKIEAKEKCLRVQFLDWLSNTLLNWSNRIHVVSSNIDSPCIIEVAPRKREDSKHAKESKEMVRLREQLASAWSTADTLLREKNEIAENLTKECAELQKEMKK